MENGKSILIDEFNLCSNKVLYNILPTAKAKINDKIRNVPKEIQNKPENFSTVKRRNVINSNNVDKLIVKKLKENELVKFYL